MIIEKAIKIENDNLISIQSALDEVNGKSIAHTLNNASEILSIVEMQEQIATNLVGKSNISGVKYIYQSGGEVPRAYGHRRRGTQITIERRSQSWFLTQVESIDLYPQGGKSQLMLTQDQEQLAIKRFIKSSGFGVQESEVMAYG